MAQQAESSHQTLLFFGGPYSNLQSLIALRAIAEEHALPPSSIICIGGRKIGVVHGSQANISEFLYASSPWEKKRQNFASLGCDIIVGGHCGVPFIKSREEKLWVNAGVIAMPANDGTRRGWYLLARDGEDGLQFLPTNISPSLANSLCNL